MRPFLSCYLFGFSYQIRFFIIPFMSTLDGKVVLYLHVTYVAYGWSDVASPCEIHEKLHVNTVANDAILPRPTILNPYGEKRRHCTKIKCNVRYVKCGKEPSSTNAIPKPQGEIPQNVSEQTKLEIHTWFIFTTSSSFSDHIEHSMPPKVANTSELRIRLRCSRAVTLL